MQTVYLTIGFPGSGKTTWAKKWAKNNNCVILNRDSLRTMFGGEYGMNFEPLVKDSVAKLIPLCLAHKKDIIIDECNLSQKTRKKYLELLRSGECNATVKYIWFFDESVCLIRRMQEPRGYTTEQWAKVIADMGRSYTIPSSEEGCEIIKVNSNGEFVT